MTIVERGIAELKAGHREEAEKLFAEGCFLGGDSVAAGYLSMIYFDEKVTNRTEESVSVARLLWAMTQDERPSAAHRLGVQYLSSGSVLSGRRLRPGGELIFQIPQDHDGQKAAEVVCRMSGKEKHARIYKSG